MSIVTPDPVDGTPVSASTFGHGVFLDLTTLSNFQSSGLIVGPSPAQVVGATTFDLMTGITYNYTKKSATSRMLVVLNGTTWTNSTFGFGTEIGVRVAGVDYPIAYTFWDAGSVQTHVRMIGWAMIAGLSVGSKTIQGVIRADTAAKNANIDFNDRYQFLVAEMETP